MPHNTESPLGFKCLTPENWRKQDPVGRHIVNVDSHGAVSAIPGDDWAERILEARLSEKVPQNIVELFEVARGVLCYGYFFYPLYTLGSEQIYRVIEAAISKKCGDASAPSKIRTFKKKIDWLNEAGLISRSVAGRLHSARMLRNLSCHADRQSLINQAAAIRDVATAVELIDGFFQA